MSRRPRRSRTRGQALAEFAIAIPVFLLVVLALFDIGRYVFAQNALTNAAREGARLAIVNQTQADIDDRVRTLAFMASTAVDPTIYLVTAPAIGDTNLDDNARCGPGQARPLGVGCIAVVRASTTISTLTPVVSTIIGPITLRATAMQPVELVCPGDVFTTCPRQP